MEFALQLMVCVVLLPLIGSIITGVFSQCISNRWAHITTITLVFIACLMAWAIGYEFLFKGHSPINADLYTWASEGKSRFTVGFLLDSLSVAMTLCVTSISLLVHIYSIGYMQGDPGYARFFSHVSLFTFAMLTLVLANNGLQLFFGWEGVGLVSYLLIGFWLKKPSASAGALKAFLVNRVGDFGFILALALVFSKLGSLHYSEIFANKQVLLQTQLMGHSVLFWVCVGCFIGAMGKSAQVPLHIWLPESMEGPTPISALIHAATMVTAGVFMITRMSPVFELAPSVLHAVMLVGAIGACFLGLVALVQNDIKRVVAYSTLSQLGYMMAGVGASAYNAAMFHLLTHACFKALLFLAAGAVIVALHHEQDMRKMGGLRNVLPLTYYTTLIGSIALVAIPPSSGFYSKDAIITAVSLQSGSIAHTAWMLLTLGTFITGLYTFRALFLTFHGSYRGSKSDLKHAEHVSPTLTMPLAILAIPSLLLGAITASYMLSPNGIFADAIYLSPAAKSTMLALANEFGQQKELWLGAIKHAPFWLSVLGIFVAWLAYVKLPNLPEKIARKTQLFINILLKEYGVEALFNIIIVKPANNLACFLTNVFDQGLIDKILVMGSGKSVAFCGRIARKAQTGYINDYVLAMILGLLALIIFFS